MEVQTETVVASASPSWVATSLTWTPVASAAAAAGRVGTVMAVGGES